MQRSRCEARWSNAYAPNDSSVSFEKYMQFSYGRWTMTAEENLVVGPLYAPSSGRRAPSHGEGTFSFLMCEDNEIYGWTEYLEEHAVSVGFLLGLI